MWKVSAKTGIGCVLILASLFAAKEQLQTAVTGRLRVVGIGGESTGWDMLADTNVHRREWNGEDFSKPALEKWLPFVDTYRTFCLAPDPQARELLLAVESLASRLGGFHAAR